MNTEIIDDLLEKEVYIIDFLPETVPKNCGGSYFDVEYYILNSKTMTFHKPECEKASRIGTKNKIYSYAEREELIGAGYTAAECCNP